MAFRFAELVAHPGFFPAVQQQSAAMLAAFLEDPRLASVFATQQRWLMGHAAMAQAYAEGGAAQPAVTLARFLDLIARHKIASRNTADAFAKEMLHYRYGAVTENAADARARPMLVGAKPVAMLQGWTLAHLLTLDRLDHGVRVISTVADPEAQARLQIAFADLLFVSPPMRLPPGDSSLFNWLTNGGVIMDWFITSLGTLDPDRQVYSTSISSLGQIAEWVTISRSHLSRKLRAVESIGGLGWEGRRGASAMWVSCDFVREVLAYQAQKLELIDQACDEALR